MNSSIQFELAEFSKIFPFYILFDENLIIQNHGPSIEKVAPDCKHKQFLDFFTIDRPLLSDVTFLEIKCTTNQLVFIKSKNADIRLKGQFNFLPDRQQIIFLGAAWFDSTETLTNSGLHLLDFAPHNPLIDLLHLLKTQEIVNVELKQLVHKLNEQKKKLLESQNQLEKTRLLLEENNIRYAYVNKATSEAIWDWNILTGEIFYGDGFEKYFGYNTQNSEQSIDVWNKRIHPEDFEQLMNSISNAIDSQEDFWKHEYRYLKADGVYSFVSDNGFIVRNENGVAIKMIGAMKDTTDRKMAEIRLNEAIESIKKTNDELEQFAYVASHDLQEPLRMVTNFLSQLDKKYSNSLDEKAKEYIYYAVDGAKRMRLIILDLLEYSRAGKSNEKLKDFDINNVIQEIEILHSRQILELNASIKKINLPVINTHKTPIRQVFQNLISNALKYHKTGIPPDITITCYPEKSNWHFVVSDNGIGIEQAYHDKIFVIFQRLHSKEEYGGTGIGLAITKKIIESIGGSIWLKSEKNMGCEFHFTIPV